LRALEVGRLVRTILGQLDRGIFLLDHDVHNGLYGDIVLLDGGGEQGEHLVLLLVTRHVNTTGGAKFATIGAVLVVSQHRVHSGPGNGRLRKQKCRGVRGGVGLLAVLAVAEDKTQLPGTFPLASVFDDDDDDDD
jgi:hypothetical protein